MKKLLIAISLTALVGFSPLAFSAGVVIKSTAFQEISAKNDKNVNVVSLVKVDKTLPGTTVVFKNEVKNEGQKPASNIVITNPVSDQLTFLENYKSQDNVDVSYSIDGKEYAKAGVLKIKDNTGIDRLARPDEFKFISWKLKSSLNAGESIELGYKAIVK